MELFDNLLSNLLHFESEQKHNNIYAGGKDN